MTAERLEGYRDLIKTATDDLEARLESIDEKLETIFERTTTESETTELRRIKEERLSTQKCLLICAQLSQHINQIQPTPIQRDRGTVINPGMLPEKITSDGMKECRISLDQTTAKLERHMQDLIEQMMAKSHTAMTQDEVTELSRLQEEWKTARQCIGICSKADNHLNENVSIIDNHATGDESVQFLVSTSEKTIHGKNRGFGSRIRQVGGHLSDDSVQQLSRDISRISFYAVEQENLSSRHDAGSDNGTTGENVANWENYGHGRKLTSRPGPNVTSNPQPLSEPRFDGLRKH